jgi:hypothetical protein
MTVFARTLTVTAVVTLFWNVIGDRAWSIDWETSFRVAVVFSVILPWAGRPRRSARARTSVTSPVTLACANAARRRPPCPWRRT